MDIATLLIRVIVGALLAGHGVQKLSHRLGGTGLSGSTAEFARDGFRGGIVTALAAGVAQTVSGLFLLFGALTPLAAISMGPGRFSLDHTMGIDALPLWVGATASLLGLLGGLGVRLLLHTDSGAPSRHGKE
ncbi:DoxX family protein [Lacisediminihabitans changchengi]|uniref:DoxX family protein n=1 Tax=Lacisediminihabitans changchengi TaxID=2787634 RepID=A0A934W2V7_9MICO|nr:DoxX family protein [Lacisediminihabitans changchengi]MBK4348303.1 DoxX family protein [Lacisediminihabitans changchengi]